MAEIIQMAFYPDRDLADRLSGMAQDCDRSVSSTLIMMLQEYLELEPIRNVLEARERRLITHEEAMDRLAVLIERDGDGAST